MSCLLLKKNFLLATNSTHNGKTVLLLSADSTVLSSDSPSQQGFQEACAQGPCVGSPVQVSKGISERIVYMQGVGSTVQHSRARRYAHANLQGVRFVICDGAAHAVDSSELVRGGS